MTLVRFDPFHNVSRLQNRVNRLFSNALFPVTDEESRGWSPTVDIFERGDDLVLRAEIPGVKQDDVDLSVDGDVLTIRGERVRDEKLSDESYHRIERSFGAFTRSFTLPSSVDSTHIVASYKDGVLEVILPKAETAKPKKIQVLAN